VFASRLGLVGVALDHLDRAYNEDFSNVAALKDSIAFAERDFRLIDFNDALQARDPDRTSRAGAFASAATLSCK
jgi:hypothetical protein